METQNKYFPVMLEEARVTKSTIALTGISNYNELLTKSNDLFKKDTEEQITDKIITVLHKGNLRKAEENTIRKMSKEEKREYLIASLTVYLTMTQAREGASKATNKSKNTNFFLNSRINIGSNSSIKYAYQPTTIAWARKFATKVGANMSDLFAAEGNFIYLQRITDYTPEKRDNQIISEPRRAGKKGDFLLTKHPETGKQHLTFMFTDPVIDENITPEQAIINYDKYYDEETANEEDFKHTAVIKASVAPDDARIEGGAFNDAYVNWLHEMYNDASGAQTVLRNELAHADM